ALLFNRIVMSRMSSLSHAPWRRCSKPTSTRRSLHASCGDTLRCFFLTQLEHFFERPWFAAFDRLRKNHHVRPDVEHEAEHTWFADVVMGKAAWKVNKLSRFVRHGAGFRFDNATASMGEVQLAMSHAAMPKILGNGDIRYLDVEGVVDRGHDDGRRPV